MALSEWLNKSKVELNHYNRSAKCQYFFWTTWQKIFLGVLMYSYAVQQNWQLYYLRALLLEYHPRPTI